jgi:hypothetical protein
MSRILPKEIKTPLDLEIQYPSLFNEASSQANKDMQGTK